MQKQILFITLFLFLSVNAFSQDANKNNAATSADTIYSHAIQYYFINDLSFAYKLNDHYPSVWSFRFDISGSNDAQSSYSERYNQNNELADESDGSSDALRLNAEISVVYSHYFTLHKSFKPYIGIGPLVSYSYNKSENEYETATSHSLKSISKSYGTGLLAVSGVESELLDYISFFIEYNLSYTYNLGRGENKQYSPLNILQSRYKSTSHRYTLSLSSAKIGIILYF